MDYEEDELHTCTYSISTKCNPNFVDVYGRTCDMIAKECQNSLAGTYDFSWYIDTGIMSHDWPRIYDGI